MAARDGHGLLDEVAHAKTRFGLCATAPVVSCDEAGRHPGLTRLSQLPEHLDARRLWAGSPIPRGVRRRWRRVSAPHQLLREQRAEVAAERRARLPTSPEDSREQVRPLMQRKGIGSNGAWLLVMAFVGWRALQTRREVGGITARARLSSLARRQRHWYDDAWCSGVGGHGLVGIARDMAETEFIEQLRRDLPTLLREHPEVRHELWGMMLEAFPSRQEFMALLDEMRAMREDTNRRFEELRQDMNRRFEAVDRRFEARSTQPLRGRRSPLRGRYRGAA